MPHLMMSTAVPAKLKGFSMQFTCTEMLHWDEYREVYGVPDNTGKMMEIFATKVEALFSGHMFTSQNAIVTACSVALDPALSGSTVQNFCSEMQHWDDYREGNKIVDGVQSMREIFYPRCFAGYDIYVLDTKKKLRAWKVMCLTATRDTYDNDWQPLCTEMIHWDDCQESSGVEPNPRLGILFGKR
ncbi:hypothetical protein DQ04_00181140 [Trypanosoma grayi]|uniref:hypothetical protein n=1 Tax=Trypanosoma grayi TaxID=71804 RepID=UPI0004F4452A|nr:hypothetical protein DQ04_00181140 [Trypanosoma grayi]KEG15121.1 hypothetical protein DQ04_00181140 [Trypanosoma grayi]